jgi:lipopolysaccharide/colanic/teichoic acid biosynthesis glycosyltransferase
VVVDDLLGDGRHAARLHWLLADFPQQTDIAAGQVTLNTPAGIVRVNVIASTQLDISLVRGGQILAGRASANSSRTRGWVSHTYTQKESALSLALEVETQLPIRSVTVFEFGSSRLESLTTSHVSFRDGGKLRIQLNAPGASNIVRTIGADVLEDQSSPISMLLVHQAFASPAEGGGTRHYELGRHMVSRGHKFTVVTSDLSYLSGKPVLARHGLFVEQEVDGLRVLRAFAFPALHRSFVWRVFSFLTFMGSSLLAGLRCGPVDLVMGTSPPIFQALSAWILALLRRRPFLLEVRDLWPEFAIDMGVLRSPLLIWLSRRLEHFLYARASHVLVNSPAYRDYLLKLGVAPLKISLISNGVDPAMFDPFSRGQSVRQTWALQNKFVVTYTGAIGMANDLGVLLNAANRLREYQDIVFLIVGDGKERANLEALARQLDLQNVVFTGTVSKAEVAEVMAASDACLAILKNIPMFRTTYPNKVFDYMAAGRPTLLAIDGVIRDVIESSQGGIFVPPGDDAALAGAVLELHANPGEARRMGNRAREYVMAHFHREHQAQQFASLIESMAGCGSTKKNRFYRRFGKRILDLTLTAPAALLIAPVLMLLALLIKLTSQGPAFFNQERLGKQGKVFKAYKFRTMTHRVRTNHVEIRDDNPEVTRLGRVLRRFKLDELPQILNVIKGDMSLVGPRPPLPSQLAEYDVATLHRLDVTPGLTGLAQVSGGTHMTWQDRWLHDLDYVRRLSFGLDLSILLRTFLVVLVGEKHFYIPPKTVGE